jgi:hypothetical protein
MVNYPLRKFSPTEERLLPMLVHEALIAFVAKTARGVYEKYGAVEVRATSMDKSSGFSGTEPVKPHKKKTTSGFITGIACKIFHITMSV